MHATRRRWLVALLYLGTALTIGAAPLAACDPVWLPIARPDGISVLVALALAETVLDTIAGPVAARTHAYSGAVWMTSAGARAAASGCACSAPPTPTAPLRREAVLVPWAYRQDCRPIEWTGKLDWIRPGTRGVVTGWLRPREHWLAELPTYDVEMAWREPVWVENDSRWTMVGADQVRMTPEEFLELYTVLPRRRRAGSRATRCRGPAPPVGAGAPGARSPRPRADPPGQRSPRRRGAAATLARREVAGPGRVPRVKGIAAAGHCQEDLGRTGAEARAAGSGCTHWRTDFSLCGDVDARLHSPRLPTRINGGPGEHRGHRCAHHSGSERGSRPRGRDRHRGSGRVGRHLVSEQPSARAHGRIVLALLRS